MRPIKFKAWNKNTKVMIDLQRITPLALVDPRAPGLFIPFEDYAELMQFTGLLDKNGKEIYEDDLIDTGTKRGRVKFLFGCWHFVDGENTYLLYPKEEGYGRGGQWKWIEVIGNIYQNPELTSQQ